MESIVFRKSLMGGFKKKDVLSFIDGMIKGAQDAEVQLNNQINALTDSRNALQKQVDDFSQRVGELEAQLTAAKEKIEYLNLENKKMQSELIRIKRSAKEEEAYLAEKEELLDRIRQLEEKGSKYDEISVKLGAIYVEAHQTAAKLVEDAKKKSDLVSSEANSIVDNIAFGIEDFRNSVDMLRSDVKASVFLIEKKLNDICKALDDSLARFKNRVLNGDGLGRQERSENSTEGILTGINNSEGDIKLSHYFN